MAMVLVLVVIAILFVLGVAVSALSVNNARLVSTVEDGARTRQAALAGMAEAQTVLNASTDWTKPMPSLTGERALPGTDPQIYYDVAIIDAPQAQSATVRCRGYMKSYDNTHRAEVTMMVRFQRCAAAFLYPVQANGTVTAVSGTKVLAPDDIAIRTNGNTAGSVSLDATVTVQGEILVGPSPSAGGVVAPAPPSATPVDSAASRAVMQPVLAPTLAPGVMVEKNGSSGSQSGSSDRSVDSTHSQNDGSQTPQTPPQNSGGSPNTK